MGREKKNKNAANRRKTACSGAFGVPDTTRTCDPGLRRLVLYPTELLGHISKLFNFSAQTDSNELPLRRRPLYPAELQAHMKLWGSGRLPAGCPALRSFCRARAAAETAFPIWVAERLPGQARRPETRYGVYFTPSPRRCQLCRKNPRCFWAKYWKTKG